MGIKKLLFFLGVLGSSLITNAQIKTWAVAVGGVGIEEGTCITQGKDGGYFIGGNAYDIGGPEYNTAYAAKVDSSGNLQWSEAIGIPNGYISSTGNSIAQANDGGCIITGSTALYNTVGVTNVYIMKLDSTGDLQWAKTIGGIRDDEGYSIVPTKDRGYAITGVSSSYGLGSSTVDYEAIYDVYVIKLDSVYNLQWTKTIGGTGDDEGNSIVQTKDDGYAITGKTNSYGAGGYDVYVIKLDSVGDLQWTKTIGGKKNDYGNSIIQSRDGGYAITGVTYSFNDTVNGDIYVVKLDSVADIQWTKTIGETGADAGQSIIQTSDGGYAIGSNFGSSSFVKLDSMGNLKKVLTYDGSCASMIQTKSDGFAMVGTTSVNGSYYYFYASVLDSAGNNCSVSNSAGGIDSGGIISSGGVITSSDSGRIGSGGRTSSYGTIAYLCSNNSGGLIVASSKINSTCQNFPDGSISLAVSGGISPYTYSWSPNVSDSSSATGLSAGAFTITVYDSVNDNVSIALFLQYIPLEFTTSISNISCRGNTNGSATITITNGTPPFTYSWSTGATAVADSGLSAGTYSVSVSDSCGDLATASVTITQTSDLTDSASVIANVSCLNGNNGSATVNISAGTSPYTYLWSDVNSQTTATATGLSAGTYTVTVADSCGSATTSSVIVTQPLAWGVDISSVTNVTCFGGNDGSATSSLNVPLVASYTFEAAVQHFTVPAGVNTITLTIAGAQGGGGNSGLGGNGANFTGVSPAIPGHTLSVVVGQQGGSNGGGGASWVYDSNIVLYNPMGTMGLIAIAGGGGGAGSSYSGDIFGTYFGGPGGNDLLTNAPTIGTYEEYAVGGTDGNGGGGDVGGGGAGWLSNGGNGRYLDSGGMDEANHFSKVSPSGSFGGFGGAGAGGSIHMAGHEANEGGGGGGYNGGAPGLGGGGGGSYFINTLPIVSDNQQGNGFVSIAYTLTSSPAYTYSWSNGETIGTATGLSAGTYTVTVRDSCGGTAMTSVTITQPATLSSFRIVTDSIPDNGNCTGSAWVTVNGGNSPYTYSWTGGDTTDYISNKCHGNYCCTVTEACGYSESVCVTITLSKSTGINNITSNTEQVTVYPNPNSGVFTVLCHSERSEESLPIIQVYNVLGQQVLTETLHSAQGDNSIDLSSQPNGIYLYRVLQEDGSLVGEGKLIIQK